jgi:signal transduction histidine kinase
VTRWIFALGVLLAAASARASESSSQRYTNLSVGGGQAALSETAVPARKTPKAAVTTPLPAPASPAVSVPPPAPPRSRAGTWLAAFALALGVAAALRSRRRADNDVLALAAHELQSPLAAIESYLDLMASEAPGASKEARRWLEDLSRMRTTTSHLRRTITDILDMTRVSDGRMKLAARPVEIAPLVETSLQAYGAHAAARGVALRASIPAGLSPALADPDRLRQVLDNLIGNAIKFTPSGRSIEIAALASGSEIVLEVRDEGVGVPAAKRASLFGKFKRLGPAVDGTEGTGLGLYLSRSLASAQGGRLEYEARAEGGSIFRVTMPRA